MSVCVCVCVYVLCVYVCVCMYILCVLCVYVGTHTKYIRTHMCTVIVIYLWEGPNGEV